ncbi:MAG: radical SAM protein [Planctomycetota bacterium]
MSASRRLKINEIFHSIQGEGTRAGMRCAFIRLTGCHLRCKYCDTAHAYEQGTLLSLDEIISSVRAYNCQTVEITGGEPLLQPPVYELMTRLADEFQTVLLETSGTLSITEVAPRVARILDIKCPDSGVADHNYWPNLELLRAGDEVKFVISSHDDYAWAKDVITRYDLPKRCSVLFTPAFGLVQSDELAGWILADRLDVRLGLQLHKLIWPNAIRGV